MTNYDPLFIHANGDSVMIRPRSDGSNRVIYYRGETAVKENSISSLKMAQADARAWLGETAGKKWMRVGSHGHVYADEAILKTTAA